MKPNETKRLYEKTCRERRIEPTGRLHDAEAARWHKLLCAFETADVERALDAWGRDTTPTATGRPRAAFVPDAAELKPLVQREAAMREAATREPKDYVVFVCEGPEQHRVSAFIRRSAIAPESACQYCGARRHVTHRCAV